MLVCIGGVDGRQQSEELRNRGVHIVVATPGRLKDMLTKKVKGDDSCFS